MTIPISFDWRPLVVIPTYNERDSLPPVLARLRAAVPAARVLIVDDGSPDGTGDWAEAQAAEDRSVHVLRRPGKGGLGSAYIAGFHWGLNRGHNVLCEMDADGSHPPERLPYLIKALDDGADLAIGSRWVKGGSVVDWPRRREALSRGANLYVSVMLGLGVHDATAGFRAYRGSLLHRLDLDAVEAQGYAFQVDMTWRAVDAGARVTEVPIAFTDRVRGESKMSGRIITEAMTLVTKWGVRRRWARLRRRA